MSITRVAILTNTKSILTCGGTVDEAAAFFIALEQACQAQLLAEAAAANGIPKKLIEEKEAVYTKQQSGTPPVLFMQFKPEYDLILKETKGEFLE